MEEAAGRVAGTRDDSHSKMVALGGTREEPIGAAERCREFQRTPRIRADSKVTAPPREPQGATRFGFSNRVGIRVR